eukprot:gene4047-4689_t
MQYAVSTPTTDSECEPPTTEQVNSDKIVVNKGVPPVNVKHGDPYFKFEKDSEGFYLIDRDSTYFNVILNYLRTGHVGKLGDLDKKMLILEAQFYHLHQLEGP